MKIKLAALALSVLLLCGCADISTADPSGQVMPEPSAANTAASDTEAEPEDEPENIPADEPAENTQSIPENEPVDEIKAMLESMSLREKIGQLFFIRADSLDLTQSPEQVNASDAVGVKELSPDMAEVLDAYPVGGLVMFAKNITDGPQLTAFIASLQESSGIPLFIAADEEGGAVARLANHPAFELPRYESAAAVGASGDPADALAMGNTIGGYLLRYGFNMDFAPVADVNTNPDNPVIGTRAFSSDGETAAAMASAMAEGLKEQGIIPVFKHFPGHGDTAEDSHKGIAVSYKSLEELYGCELLPYMSLTETDCVMVGHIALPDVTGGLTPSTLSADIIEGLLRGTLGFEGVVLTDSMAMEAITLDYSPGEAAVMAIAAGCDIILGPEEFIPAFEGLLEAVESGKVSEERIDESVYRVLSLKKAYGLI